MRAVSDSPELAKVSGIDVEVIVKATWCVGGFCAVAAGVFLAMIYKCWKQQWDFKCFYRCSQQLF